MCKLSILVLVLALCLLLLLPSPAEAEYSEVQVIQETENFLENPHYLDNNEIGELFAQLGKDYPELAQTYEIGKSLENRPIHALALSAPTSEIKEGDLLRPMVKLVANVRGDEALGRQIVLYAAEYLASHYLADEEVQRLLNTTEIHFLPTCNPDGFAAAKVSHESYLLFS
ncbi:hypothetical protein KR032_006710 [Drosophila birchii]|nr:hypothetical protein KR032_006710 [Drosophila birchii]